MNGEHPLYRSKNRKVLQKSCPVKDGLNGFTTTLLEAYLRGACQKEVFIKMVWQKRDRPASKNKIPALLRSLTLIWVSALSCP
jgi:hypothetical protein